MLLKCIVILLINYTVYGVWVNQVTDNFVHLETPHWDPVTQALYFVDQKIGYVFKFDPISKNLTRTYLGSGSVSPILTVEGSNNIFIVGRGRQIIRFRWDGVSETPQNVVAVAVLDQQYPDNYIYGGKADSKGRIWIATSNEAETATGGLYLVEPLRNWTVTKKLTVSKAAGMEWNSQDDSFFIVDSALNNITRYDYNSTTATITNPQILDNAVHNRKFAVGGLVVDNSPQMWYTASVEFGAGFVANAEIATGKSNVFISVSPLKVTNLCWGGQNNDILFVTTSRVGLTDSQLGFYIGAGALFAFTDVMAQSGTPPFKVELP